MFVVADSEGTLMGLTGGVHGQAWRWWPLLDYYAASSNMWPIGVSQNKLMYLLSKVAPLLHRCMLAPTREGSLHSNFLMTIDHTCVHRASTSIQ